MVIVSVIRPDALQDSVPHTLGFNSTGPSESQKIVGIGQSECAVRQIQPTTPGSKSDPGTTQTENKKKKKNRYIEKFFFFW